MACKGDRVNFMFLALLPSCWISYWLLPYSRHIACNYQLNMTSQLMNERCCIKHCWGVYEQNTIVISVHVNNWTAEWPIIVSICFSQPFVFLQNVLGLTGSLAGYLMFIGQTADAACTPLVGYFSDKSSGCYKFGRRKCWHAFGKFTHIWIKAAKVM